MNEAKPLSLSVLLCTVSLALSQPILGQDRPSHQFVRELGTILAESTPTTGVMIVGILDGTPATAAGLLPEDIVILVGERAIARVADVFDALAPVAPVTSVQIVVRRADQERTFRLTPGR